MNKLNILTLLLALGALAITGCGDSLPERVKVQGKVTWQGQPLDNAMVTFQPIDKGETPPLRPAKGYTDAQGAYQLSSFRTNDGAMPGKYAVLIHVQDAYSIDGNSSVPAGKTIPEKYTRSTTTDLTATIPSDAAADLVFDFDLKP